MIHRHFYIDFGNMYLNIQNAYKQQNGNIKAAWYEEKPTFEESLTYRICITSYFHNVFSVNTYNTLEQDNAWYETCKSMVSVTDTVGVKN